MKRDKLLLGVRKRLTTCSRAMTVVFSVLNYFPSEVKHTSSQIRLQSVKFFKLIIFQKYFQSRNFGLCWKKNLLLSNSQRLMNRVTLLPCDNGWMNIPCYPSGLSSCDYISGECSYSPGSRPKAVNRSFDKLHTHLFPAFNATALRLSLHTHSRQGAWEPDGRTMFQSC